MLDDVKRELFSPTFPAHWSMGVLPVSLKMDQADRDQNVEIYFRTF